ncbi:MAG: ABC transporter ATP-binding protein [Candidatus Heimdallarchaeota archaeon]|nr:ABC transporter ATP-binding protein [Candidatus Heimdallarchaeota archaeon]
MFIHVKNIHFRYPGQRRNLLNGVTLRVDEFQIVVIVGKLGSGKSSVLKHMNGLHKPSKGHVVVDGINVSQGTTIHYEKIGFLFENPEDQIFYPVVADDVAFGPRNLGLKKELVHRRVIEACQEVGILHLLDRETISLSLGEKTLVALAGLLAMKPKVLLLDSPGVGLDIWTKPKVIETIKKLSHNHTVVITSNDKEFIKIADRIYLLHEGKIKGSYKSYQNFRRGLSRRSDDTNIDTDI